MEDISKVIRNIKDFADRAHGEQKRKYSDERYIFHPIRVMEICKEYTGDISVLSAALLHDVLEDTAVTQNEIREFIKDLMNDREVDKTVHLVEELTDIYTKETFPQLNRRIRKEYEINRLVKISPEGQMIKYADVIDNVANIVQHDPDFARVFIEEGKLLLLRMNKGDQRLYSRAMKTVEESIFELRKRENSN